MPYYISAIRRDAHGTITHLNVGLDVEGSDAQTMAVFDAVKAIHFQGQEWYTAPWKKGVAFEGARVHAHLGDDIQNPHVHTQDNTNPDDELDALPTF